MLKVDSLKLLSIGSFLRSATGNIKIIPVILSAYPDTSRQSGKMRRSKRLWDKLLVVLLLGGVDSTLAVCPRISSDRHSV